MSSTTTTASTSTAPSSGGGGFSGMSFVGNTPSTVLFFIAMAVGVLIAILFLFFTIRYFVRASFGLHLYSASSRGMMFSPRSNDGSSPVAYTDREIQEHLEYLRTHHYLRDDFLERRLYGTSGRRRRRRRRGRFAKMKKLTPEEVQKLFPQTSYADWLSTGDDVSSVSVEVAKDDSSVLTASAKVASISPIKTGSDTAYDVVELESSAATNSVHAHANAHAHDADASSSSESSKVKAELHFDSGSCSICLEVYESDDTVRGLICGHVFHAECVDPWLTRRRACCPICKRDYYKEENANGAEGSVSNIEEREEANAEASQAAGEEGQEGQENDTGRAQAEIASQSVVTPANEPNSASRVDIATSNTDENGNDNNDMLRDLNYDQIRADTNIQALFNELIPLSERVRVLLEEHPHLNMDERAKEMSRAKYSNVFKYFFWKLMGITKTDLYNWAVIKIYREESASSGNTANATSPVNDEVADQQPISRSNGTSGTTGAGEAVEMSEIRRSDTLPQSRSTTANAAYASTEEDLADAARRREYVQDRV